MARRRERITYISCAACCCCGSPSGACVRHCRDKNERTGDQLDGQTSLTMSRRVCALSPSILCSDAVFIFCCRRWCLSYVASVDHIEEELSDAGVPGCRTVAALYVRGVLTNQDGSNTRAATAIAIIERDIVITVRTSSRESPTVAIQVSVVPSAAPSFLGALECQLLMSAAKHAWIIPQWRLKLVSPIVWWVVLSWLTLRSCISFDCVQDCWLSWRNL